MILGRGDSEISSTLNAMRLEEQARAALAEANYRVHQGEKLECLHSLEGENLDLGCISNSQRGFSMKRKGVAIQKGKGSKLSRELKRISIQ